MEIDSEIHDVAKQWFGLPQDERMSVNVTDGVEYITQLSQQGRLRDACMNYLLRAQSLDCVRKLFNETSFMYSVGRGD